MTQRLAIGGSTRVVALLGDPVAHSLSPALHNAAFVALGLDWVYVALRVPAAAVPQAVAGLHALGFAGANVTVPHKQAVRTCLEHVVDDAVLTGAVNTIVVESERLVGHNTDVEGFRRALRSVAPEGVAGAEALLIGAGGAARAVAVALVREAVGRLVVAGRTPRRAEEVAGLVAAVSPSTPVRVVPLDELDGAAVRAAPLLVNASSLGMPGTGQVPRVLVDNVGVDHVVYDVVYGPRPTELAAAAAARGARVGDGRRMLVEQAAAAFELWTGREAPRGVMLGVVEDR
jgi:shikimate dehydrogenase